MTLEDSGLKECLHSFYWGFEEISKTELTRHLAKFDLDNDDCLSHTELHELLLSLFTEFVNTDSLEHFILEKDVKGSGVIDVSELAEAII
jgi:Ca2+-binding EF-hand superfamily protein